MWGVVKVRRFCVCGLLLLFLERERGVSFSLPSLSGEPSLLSASLPGDRLTGRRNVREVTSLPSRLAAAAAPVMPHWGGGRQPSQDRSLGSGVTKEPEEVSLTSSGVISLPPAVWGQ